MRFSYNGTIIAIDAAFGIQDGTNQVHFPHLPEAEGVTGYNYPAGYLRMLTPAERTAKGFTEVAEPERFDERWFTAPGVQRPLAACKITRLTDLGALRYQKETGGIEIGEMQIATDRETQGVLTAARTLAKENPAYTVNWKAALGLFVTLDAPTIISIADAVALHVQACFTREMELSNQIGAAANLDLLLDIDITTGWPA